MYHLLRSKGWQVARLWGMHAGWAFRSLRNVRKVRKATVLDVKLKKGTKDAILGS